MIHKTKTTRRFVRRQHIAKRCNILRHVMMLDEDMIAPLGMYDKGKIHCSCALCSCKSTVDRGHKTNSKREYSISDKRKFDRINYAD